MLLFQRKLLTFILIVLISCNDNKTPLFTLLNNNQTGIRFKNELFESSDINVMSYAYFYNGGGVSIGDINNDGLQDILFTGNMVKNSLYLNRGNFQFENITDISGVADKHGWCTGATMVDINGDGKLDIYICRSADDNPTRRKNLLFINNGDLTFSEKADEYGLSDEGYSTQASFFDYDKDGDLDMFLINHSLQQYSTGIREITDIRNQKDSNFATKLYRNENNHFVNVSDQAGITSNVLSFGLGVAIADVNKDGWSDIYVSNDFNEPDYLFMNNKNGTFTNKLNDFMDHISMFSMGSDFADYNNDGNSDLVTLDMLPEDNRTQKMHSGAENFDKMQMLFNKGFYFQFSRNMLQKNNGDGTFSEVAQLAGVSNTDWSWSSLFSDLDNDGNKDLLVTNGYVRDYTEFDFLRYLADEMIKARAESKDMVVKDIISKMPSHKIANYVFQNSGNGTFIKRTNEWGFDQPGVSTGAAYVDLDNDGDLDVVINNTNDFASIYRNNSEILVKNNYLKIKLSGDQKNERGIGAKVTVYCKDKLYYQEQMPVRGFQSSVDPVLNFGMGKNAIADSVVVIWPNDKVQVFKDVKVNQTLRVKIQEASGIWRTDSSAISKPYFSPDSTLNFTHKENTFNDFNIQNLLLNYLSRPGPCMAKSDVNKDGREDLYIGGARGQAGQLFIRMANGRFVNLPQPAFVKDSMNEDAAAEFFDADSDGDMDLYVSSGGYEVKESDSALQDRLYINNRKGNFIKKDNCLPKNLSATGTVKAADIDGDGDMDLFVGSRLIPGKYPVIPDSKILLNNGKGTFTDATASAAPAIQKTGMVTDALWIDLNRDKQPDLIVVGEWMPIKVFINHIKQKGKLIDESSTYIKFASNGWWNRILGEDFDDDGDLDLVIGNLGNNAQFRANETQPLELYYKDFDGNGSIDPLFCYYIDGVSYPSASRDDLMDQVPGLKKKFLKYSTYATATINDMFSKEQLQDAGLLKANLLSTVYLQNNGEKGFVKKQLPQEVQYSPVYAIAALDANGDGYKDLVLAGNNVWTRIKFGRYDANHGMLLLGNDKGNFTYAPQTKSGFNVRGDVRAIQIFNNNGHSQLIFGLNDSHVKGYNLY